MALCGKHPPNYLPLAGTPNFSHRIPIPRTAPKAFYGTPGDLKQCSDALAVSWEEVAFIWSPPFLESSHGDF